MNTYDDSDIARGVSAYGLKEITAQKRSALTPTKHTRLPWSANFLRSYPWELTQFELHDTETSPYEDYATALPYISHDPRGYRNWRRWKKSRAEARTQSLHCLPPSFACFPDLPAELRQKIWTSALPGRRIVRMTYDFGTRRSSLYATDKRNGYGELHSPMQNPVLLEVNREARAVTLRHYTIFPNLFNPDTGIPLYFDFVVDVLFPCPRLANRETRLLRSLIDADTRARVQNLALRLNSLEVLLPLISMFNRRLELIMVLTIQNNEYETANDCLYLCDVSADLARDEAGSLIDSSIRGSNPTRMVYNDGASDGDSTKARNAIDSIPGNFMNTKKIAISDDIDQEIVFFQNKWRLLASVAGWKRAPTLSFATLECRRVKSRTGLVSFRLD